MRSTCGVDSTKSVMYRRGAAASAVIGIVIVVIGIVFYADSRPVRGLVSVIAGALLLLVGAWLAFVERRANRGRPW